jgi:hypothetical protein
MKDRAERCGLGFDADYLRQEHLRPNPFGVLRDSRTGFYRWFPPKWRPIGKAPHANEQISPTAIDRLQHDPTYRPRNLLEYLEKHTPRSTDRAG